MEWQSLNSTGWGLLFGVCSLELAQKVEDDPGGEMRVTENRKSRIHPKPSTHQEDTTIVNMYAPSTGAPK